MSGKTKPAWPEHTGRRILDQIDSTNAAALQSLPNAGETGFWLLARKQTAGRGRQGRRWRDPLGNFAASYCMVERMPAAEAGLRSFVAALALSDALSDLTGRSEAFSLKWPNDVLLNGGKLAGILLESTGQGAMIDRLCIGIGVNLIAAPDPADLPEGAFPPMSLLAQTGVRLAPEELLDQLAPALAGWEARLRQEGFGPIRDAWLDRAAHRGERIEVRTGDRRQTGVFETVDDSGALVLQDRLMRHIIPAGDVFFLD